MIKNTDAKNEVLKSQTFQVLFRGNRNGNI